MPDLCTVANVRDYMNDQAANSAALTLIVDWVSRRMEAFAKTQITLLAVTHREEIVGEFPEFNLDHRVDSVTSVTEGTTVLTAAQYEVVRKRILVRKDGVSRIGWDPGSVVVVYDAGYTTIPTDWVKMATKQCRHEFNQHGLATADVFGETSRSGGDGETAGIVAPDWLPDVEKFLLNERRKV